MNLLRHFIFAIKVKVLATLTFYTNKTMSAGPHGFVHFTHTKETVIKKWQLPTEELQVHLINIPIVSTGMIQQASLLIDASDNPVIRSIFLIDDERVLKPIPTAQAMFTGAVTQLFAVHSDALKATCFPCVGDLLTYSSQPISPGISYASEPSTARNENNGLTFVILSTHPKPIKAEAIIRFYTNGT